MPCSCGQSHVIAVYNEEPDEWAVPAEVHAFTDCTAALAFMDKHKETHPETFAFEGMSTRRSHHAKWLAKYEERQAVYEHWNPKSEDDNES